MKLWLGNNIESYSTNNEGKSIVAERFIRTLKNKAYKNMTAASKNVYTDKLDDMVNEFNNTYHRAIKMKPIDVKANAYFDSIKEVNVKDPKFQVGDHVRISKCKSNFAKVYRSNCSKKDFVIIKIKKTCPWTYVIDDPNGEEIIGTFYKKELQKTSQQKFNGKVMIIDLIAG